jgi:hypothetical protein
MILAEAPTAAPLIGHAQPRIAPPVPARSDIAGFRETAAGMGIELMPWQEVAARYLTATDADDRPLFHDVCIVVARQDGKTTLMKPFIIEALRAGKKILHIAQTRELPRQMFGIIASELPESLFLKRRGKGGKMQTVWPRHGAGSEEILLANGGSYRIAAASQGGARGQTNDIVIIDELREMENDDVVSAAEPTLVTSKFAQMVYLSNAGTDQSVVLNAIRDRAGKDPSLAYLEWSASPERSADDREGWAEANPAIGHIESMLDSLEKAYVRHKLGGSMSTFETEHLCRWVVTMRERLVDEAAWARCEVPSLDTPTRPFMAVSMDPSGGRASAALAWQRPDETIGLRMLFDVPGDPIDTDALGKDLRQMALRMGVTEVAYDPLTDAELAKFFKKSRKVQGSEYANASSRFDLLVKAKKLQWVDCASVTDDLVWTARKPHDESGSFQAVRANDERPITGALAAIRAVYLASGPKPATPRVL